MPYTDKSLLDILIHFLAGCFCLLSLGEQHIIMTLRNGDWFKRMLEPQDAAALPTQKSTHMVSGFLVIKQKICTIGSQSLHFFQNIVR